MEPRCFEGEVTGLSHKGLGVVRDEGGRVFFVPGAFPGDVAEFEVTRFDRRYGFARLKDLKNPSDVRRESVCHHQGVNPGQCGGCPWMPMAYDAQLEQKQTRVLHSLKRVGIEIEKSSVREIWPSEREFGYRNRAQFKTDGNKIGFVSSSSKVLVDVDECAVLNPSVKGFYQGLRAQIPHPGWTPSGDYLWNFIEVDDEMDPEVKVPLNSRRAFRQGNSFQNERMREWLEGLIQKNRPRVVLELFCGAGNFTEVIARCGVERIHAAEIARSALESLRQKNLAGVHVHECNLMEGAVWKNLSTGVRAASEVDTLVLDPPREGLERRKNLFKYFPNIKNVYYVSCDPDSLARDIKFFDRFGFQVKQLQPLDLFPQTPHVECLVWLSRD